MFDLYHHGSSVCAAKVRLAMAEKDLGWTGHYVDILKGEQFTPAYLKLNPKAVVPTLVHDGRVVTESTVICEYLDEVVPARPVLPKDPYLRHKARLWTKAVDEDLHPACAVVTFTLSHRHTLMRLGPAKLEEFLNATPPQSVSWDWKQQKRRWVEQGLDAPGAADRIVLYDKYLAKMEDALAAGTPWLVGDAFTMADIALVPYVNRLAALSLEGMWENGRRPRVADWWKRVKARPTFKPALVDWVPGHLADDLRTNGAKSWPAVAKILGIG
jgi:glutathione S-transferase